MGWSFAIIAKIFIFDLETLWQHSCLIAVVAYITAFFAYSSMLEKPGRTFSYLNINIWVFNDNPLPISEFWSVERVWFMPTLFEISPVENTEND